MPGQLPQLPAHWPWLGLALAVCVATSSVAGQDQTRCSYDECALMVKTAFWGPRIVRGAEEAHVARIGIIAPRLDLFAISDSATRHYDAFRGLHNSGGGLFAAGFAMMYSALLFAQDHEAVGLGLVGGGALLTFVGTVRLTRASNELDRAVWWYNRELR